MAETRTPIKVVLAKCGMDGHDRGIVMVSQWLRDSGMEVVYLGPYQTPKSVAKATLQEDAHLVGLSFLSGGHVQHCRNTVDELRRIGLTVPVFVGGIIPKVDIPALKDAGVQGIFPAGTPMADILGRVREAVS